MKFFVAIALLAAVASAYVLPANINLTAQELAEVNEIMAAIHSPSTDPTTAVMLEQMLFDLLGVSAVKPPQNIPAIIEEFEPPHASPVIVDFPLPESAVEATPVSPAAPARPPAPAATASPLVQIIVNVNQQDGSAPSPVQVDHIGEPTPVVVVENPEVKPTPVQVVDENLEAPELVIVSDLPEVVALPEPVLVGEMPEPVVLPEPVIIGQLPEFVALPEPVLVGEVPEVVAVPEPVIIGELPEAVALPEPVLVGEVPEAVVVSPIIIAPAVVGPEILN